MLVPSISIMFFKKKTTKINTHITNVSKIIKSLMDDDGYYYHLSTMSSLIFHWNWNEFCGFDYYYLVI